MINQNSESAVNTMYGRNAVQPDNFTEFVSSNSNGSLLECNAEFQEGVKKSKQQMRIPTDDDVHNEVADKTHENRSLLLPESSKENEPSDNLYSAPPVEAERDEELDPHKSINDIRELLVGPIQRQNESRLEEILTLIESSKIDDARKMKLQRKQFGNLSLKLYDKTKSTLSKLDDRLDAFRNTMEENRTEIHGAMAVEVAGLTELIDSKIQSVSDSVDSRISDLTVKINGEMNNTISELGRAITRIGDSTWQNK